MTRHQSDPKRQKGQLLGAALLVVAVSLPVAAQPRPRQYAEADIQYGSRIFATQCTVCHGSTGDAVAGVDLRSGNFKRAANDGELSGIIREGISGTAMPPFSFTNPELTAIVAYLRNMRDFDASKTPLGDAARGKTVFEGSGGCTQCHRVNGQGPRMAPDLTDIGALRSADALQQSLLDPVGSLSPAIRTVRAVTKDGTVIMGRRLNEDTYTVQIIDEKERLRSLVKADLKELSLVRTPRMPSYKEKLSDTELADVLAYLLSLKGH